MKLAKNTFFLVGLIFTIIGSVFAVIGVAIFMSFFLNGGSMTVNGVPVYYEPGTVGMGSLMFLLIFGGLGLIFVIVGVILLALSIARHKTIKGLLDNGQYVTARVIDVVQNRSVRVNGRYPYNIICQYDDNFSGQPHVFQSDNILHHPGDIIDFNVKVYVDRSNWDLYYVDENSLMNMGNY